MAQVRMLHHISGGRGTYSDTTGAWEGSEWPQAGGILECGDREAAELVAAGIAENLGKDKPPAAPAVRSEPAASDDTQEKPRPVQGRTGPRVATVKPGE